MVVFSGTNNTWQAVHFQPAHPEPIKWFLVSEQKIKEFSSLKKLKTLRQAQGERKELLFTRSKFILKQPCYHYNNHHNTLKQETV